MKCKLCGSRKIEEKFVIDRFSKDFLIYRCEDCGFQFQNVNKDILYSFYDEGYYTGKNEYSYYDERVKEKFARYVWKKRINVLKKLDRSSEVKRFLDVGCAFGGLMKVAEENGYISYGVEVSPYAEEYLKKRFGEDRIFFGSIEDINLPEDFFSVVTLIEVIEHLIDPVKAIENVFKGMKQNGVLLIQTANIDGFQAKLYGKKYHYYLPGHISYFNKKNLKKLLERTGFRKIKIISGVEFGLLPKLLKSRGDFKGALEYIKWIRIILYHILSKLGLTSSMVILAIK